MMVPRRSQKIIKNQETQVIPGNPGPGGGGALYSSGTEGKIAIFWTALQALGPQGPVADIEDAYGDGPPPPTFEFPTIVAALKHCGSFCSFWCFCISWISVSFE